MLIFERDISKSEEDQPINTWRLCRDSDPARTQYPSIRDSNGDFFGLSAHQISAEGAVMPSVVCPYGCGFHQFITLKGWGAIEEPKQH